MWPYAVWILTLGVKGARMANIGLEKEELPHAGLKHQLA